VNISDKVKLVLAINDAKAIIKDLNSLDVPLELKQLRARAIYMQQQAVEMMEQISIGAQ